MEKNNRQIPSPRKCVLFSLFTFILLSSASFAQDTDKKAGQDIIVSATILSVTGTLNSEWISSADDGFSNNSSVLFHSDHSYGMKLSNLSGEALNEFDPEKSSFKVTGPLMQMASHLLKYFNVADGSMDAQEPALLLKSKVNGESMDEGQTRMDDFEFNLSLKVGYDTDSILKMDAIKLESNWNRMSVNAVYHPDEKEVDLGLSSTYINEMLLDGMRLEFQASPSAAKGAVLITMDL